MVLPTDIQMAFVSGAFFVDMGRKYIEKEHNASPERSKLAYCKFRNLGILYAALFLGPVIAIFFSAWPAWESQYWTSYAEVLKGNGYLSSLAGIYMFLLVVGGYFGARLSFNWVIRGYAKLVRPVYMTVLIITMAIFLLKWPAPIKLGSVEQFKADPYSMPFIWTDPTFIVMFGLLLTYCTVPYIIMFFKLRCKR